MSDYQGNIVIKNPATPTGPSTFGRAPGMWKLSDVAYWIKQGVWPNPSVIPDQFFPYVSLLLSTTSLGNANNNLFTDSSGAFNPISRSGNATQGSATPYSTNWSNYFDGSGDFLSVPDNAALDFETGDFTVEMWVYFPATVSANNALIAGWTTGEPVSGWVLGADGTNFYFVSAVSTVYATQAVNTAARTPGVWHHVAAVRSSGSVTVYVNGVGGTPVSNTQNITTAATGLNIGRSPYTANPSPFTGYISNLRMVKGTAVYTSNFTPSTTPLTAISGTSLLTCQSNRFRDASTNNFTVTSNGDTRVTDYGPFSPIYPGAVYNQSDITNWSGYFDGSGDDLRIASNSGFSFGTGDFTIEGWCYLSSNTGNYRVIVSIPHSSGWVQVRFGGAAEYNSLFQVSILTTAASNVYSTQVSQAAALGRWMHFAFTRSSGTCRVFLDGVQQNLGTGTNPSSFPSSSFSDSTNISNNGTVSIGNDIPNSTFYIGNLSNIRMVKGTAVYTSNFTPPTTNLTAISGTSLLTLQNAAFTDNSTNNFPITITGNTTATGNSPFNTVGYWSNYFDGSGDWLDIAANSAFDLSGDFTWEFWVNTTRTVDSWVTGYYVSNPGFTTQVAYLIAISGGNYIVSLNSGSTETVITIGTAASISNGAWNHIACTRNGNTVRTFVNGALTSTTTYSSTLNNPVGAVYRIGGITGTFEDPFAGYISNLRVVKGTAVYTAAFTPTTTPLTAISGTSLLTCQASRLIDNSTNAFTITRNGDVSVQSFDPFYTATIASNGGSMYFDGSGDYLSLPDSPALQLGSSSFTVEYWWYPVSIAGYQTPFEKGYTGSGALLMQTGNGDGIIYVYASGSAVITASTAVGAGRWNHVALVRNGTSLVLYLNGVSIGSATNSTDFNNTGVMGIGANVSGGGAGAYPINGYMSDVRVTKGTAVYTAAFTPPTAPVTPTAATTLLLNGMNAGIYDATTINDMETVGNAQVRYPWPFAPANYWAGWFDGNGDYLSYPEQAGDLGTVDWTLECWAYPTATPPNYASLLNKNWTFSLQTGDFQWSIKHDDGFMSFAYVGSGGGITNITSTLAPALNTWTHYAVTRSGTTLRIYANGVLNTTATLPAGLSFGTASTIPVFTGYNSRDNCYYTGYISNLRVVAGTALYTGSTYTVPTTPLTAITNTSLLTCQNKTFIDNSSNAFTITSFGNAAAGAIGPFTATGGTSTYFDGSGDNLFMPSSPSMNCGTGNWTVEGWVCTLTRTTNYPLIFGNNRGGFTTDALAITASNSDSASFNDKFVVAWGSGGWSSPSAGNSALLVSNVTNANGVWYHLAIVRNGTSVKMYRNGIEVASATVSSGATFNWGFNGSLAGGGNWDGAQGNWNGYLDELRVTNGVARYTANFTPPTQAFPTY